MPDIRPFTAPTRWAGALTGSDTAQLSDEDYVAVGSCIESLIERHGNAICFDREDLGGRKHGYERYGGGPGPYSVYRIHHTLPARKATP